MRRWGAAGLLLAVLAAPVLAQQPVVTQPYPATTAGGNASSTITVTDTFQRIFASTSSAPSSGPPGAKGRKGCTVINNGTNNMWVAEGLTAATATKAGSLTLAVGQAYYCHPGAVVLVGEIDITGTAGEGFYAAQW